MRVGTWAWTWASTLTGGGTQRSSVSCRMPSVSMLKPDRAASCRHDSGAAGSARAASRPKTWTSRSSPRKPPAISSLHDVVALEAERDWHDLGHQLGMAAGGGEHPVRLGRVHAHARSVSTCLPASSAASVMGQCRYGQVPMTTASMSGSATTSCQCSADARDAELAGDGRGRFGPAVADGDEFHVGQGPQARECAAGGCWRRPRSNRLAAAEYSW